MTTRTPPGRVLYPSLTETAKINGEDTGKYQVTLLFPPDADLSELEACVAAAVKEKFGNKAPSNLRTPIRDATETGKLDADEFAGWKLIRFKSKNRPACFDQNVHPLDPGDPDGIYSGAWAVVSAGAYGYDFAGNRGAAFWFRGLQKVKDDERIGTQTDAADDFEPLAKPAKGEGLSFI